MKKILIINGHPNKESYCNELAKSYKVGADNSGAECKILNLYDLEFDPILRYGYTKRTELEPDLIKAQEDIKNANHLVFVYPNWWSTPPALLKGFIERVFLPGFAFKSYENSILSDKLLKKKTARLITTMDSPKWYYSLFLNKPGHNAMKKGLLQFCGIKPVKITALNPIKTSNEEKRKMWLNKIEKLGMSMN